MMVDSVRVNGVSLSDRRGVIYGDGYVLIPLDGEDGEDLLSMDEGELLEGLREVEERRSGVLLEFCVFIVLLIFLSGMVMYLL